MPTLRDVLQAILGRRLSNPGREFFNAAVESGDWTATIRGSGTAGTYEIATQYCRYTRIGRRVWLDFYIVMASSITGGGTSFLTIDGAPYAKATSVVTHPRGPVWTDGVDWPAGAALTLSITGTALQLSTAVDDGAENAVAISGLSANDRIAGSISYETDDP